MKWWFLGIAFVLGVSALAYWDASTCAEYGPEYVQTTFITNPDGTIVPMMIYTQDCVRRKP